MFKKLAVPAFVLSASQLASAHQIPLAKKDLNKQALATYREKLANNEFQEISDANGKQIHVKDYMNT